jgi:D-glycero-alpha-D-manno-heptose-7-phosphate kinase
MIVRSKAPLRISFAGGGTDVSPYIEERGGVVLNTTIDKYAYATLITRPTELINVKSLDYGNGVSFNCNEKLEYDGNLDLVKAAVKTFKVERGFDLLLHTDAAPGTGLGSSSTLTTAIIGVFKHWLGLPLTDYQLAQLAYQIERVEVGIKGGKQDQYATVFGGVNFIEFFADKTVVNPLRIKAGILNELEYRLLLCDTRRSRLSSEIIDEQVTSYIQRKEDVVRALDETKAIAIDMKNAFLLGRVDEIGCLLDEGWKVKKRFSAKMSTPLIDELYDLAKKNGAIGGKLLGAGGGGHLLLLCHHDTRHRVAKKLIAGGGNITPFAFEFRGLQTWDIPE